MNSNIRNVKRRWSLTTSSLRVPDPDDDLIRAIKSYKLVPLVGAGISRQASTQDGEKLPTWREFIIGLADRALQLNKLNKNEYKQIDILLNRGRYLMVAETLREKLQEDNYERYLMETFEIDLKPAPIHKAIRKLKAPLILTTNYDHLLEDNYPNKIRSRARTQEQSNLVQNDMQNWTPDKPPTIFKIHGSISQPETIVLTERDYRNLIYNKSGYRTILSSILVTHTILMLGFSFEDPELTQLFGFMREAFKYKSRKHYILISNDDMSELEKDYNSTNFGVIPIIYHKSSIEHPEVLLFIEKLVSVAYGKTQKALQQDDFNKSLKLRNIRRR